MSRNPTRPVDAAPYSLAYHQWLLKGRPWAAFVAAGPAGLTAEPMMRIFNAH